MKLTDFLVNLRTAINGINDNNIRKQLVQILNDFTNCKNDENRK